jgi:hypothetical protein
MLDSIERLSKEQTYWSWVVYEWRSLKFDRLNCTGAGQMNCRDDGSGVGNCIAKFCVQSFSCSDLPVSSCKPSSERGHTAPVVVVYDDRHDDRQQSDEAKLSDNGQLEFPK